MYILNVDPFAFTLASAESLERVHRLRHTSCSDMNVLARLHVWANVFPIFKAIHVMFPLLT